MSNHSGEKGTKWETAIVTALKAAGYVNAERRRLGGKRDRGDIAGIPGIVIEAKNTNRLALSEAVDEAVVEAQNDGGSIGVAWVHRKGKGSAADGYTEFDKPKWCAECSLAAGTSRRCETCIASREQSRRSA